MAVDISVIQKLTNLSEINRLLHETVAKERGLDQELDKLLAKRTDLERSFLLLHNPTAEMLELVRADCEQMLIAVSSTASLAEHISSKVRRLDTVQTRVAEVVSKIDLVLDRTNCINGVQSAMEAEDFESAAKYIASFVELEKRLGASGSSIVDAGQAEDQRQVLLAAQARLEGVVARRMEEAIGRRDAAAVLRFVKLCPPLGKRAEGLSKLVEFLRLVAGSSARATLTTATDALDAGKKVDFASVLSAMFREVVHLLEEHEALAVQEFGAAAVADLVAGLQAEMDVHGARLLQRYADWRKLDRVVREVTGRRRNNAGAGGAAPGEAGGLDHRTVEGTIEEILRLAGLCEEYSSFLLSKVRTALTSDALPASAGSSSAAPGSGTGGTAASSGLASRADRSTAATATASLHAVAEREALFRSGAFSVAVRELLGRYVALEEYYMDETTAMAMRIDEQVSDSLTSSMVDDVFFILRKVGLRALAAGQFQASAAILSEVNNVLANTFRNAVVAKINQGQGTNRLLSAVTSLLPGAEPAGGSLQGPPLEHVVSINNADVAADYAGRLRSELEGALGVLLAAPADREKARTVLADLGKTAGEFRGLAGRALDAAAEGLLPRLKHVLDDVAAASYSLSEAQYSASELAGGGWPGRLAASLTLLSAWLRNALTTNTWEGLFQALLEKLASRLEALLLRKSFTQLGGLQLDRDVRVTITALSELTSRTVRDKLARLTQMALLLSLEAEKEVLEYWTGGSSDNDTAGAGAGGSISWRLSTAEVRSVMGLRADFNKDTINAVPL